MDIEKAKKIGDYMQKWMKANMRVALKLSQIGIAIPSLVEQGFYESEEAARTQFISDINSLNDKEKEQYLCIRKVAGDYAFMKRSQYL